MSRGGTDFHLPRGYEGFPAKEKLDWLWTTLIEATRYDDRELPALKGPARSDYLAIMSMLLRRKVLARTLVDPSDLMAPGRPKFIHTQGTVARVELAIDEDSPYTGLLASGAVTPGLCRFSLASPPGSPPQYTPGMGLKLLVDGQASCNVVAMNHVNGQGDDHDLFRLPFTTSLDYPSFKELHPGPKFTRLFFKQVSYDTSAQSLRHLAAVRPDGAAEERVRCPHHLAFRPAAEVAGTFAGRAFEDYRRTLARIPATEDHPVTLYEVDGVQVDGTAHPIGRLVARSPFVASAAGERLHFRHVQEPELQKPAVEQAQKLIDASQRRGSIR